MKRTTLPRMFFLLISVVLALTLFSFPFLRGVAATPTPESKFQAQKIPDKLKPPDKIIENHSIKASKRYENNPLDNPNNQTSESLSQDTFYALADTTVVQGFPVVNFGFTHALDAGFSALDLIQRSLLYFHIASLPPGQNIIDATLRVRYSDAWGSSDYITITTHRITSNWAEGTVTWNNAPGFGESYGSQPIHDFTDVYYEFDVTNLVRGWYDGSFQNYGLMLRGPETSIDPNRRSFWSRETDSDPELVIQYEPDISPPTISGLPDKQLSVNTNQNNAIDLWAYASDAEDADSALSFTINNNPNPGAGVSIDSNRYIDINPASGWTGVTNVAIEVMDTDGYSDIDSFQVTVYDDTSPSPPTIVGLPDKNLMVNTSLDNAIDLWAYANDAEDADAALSFIINNNPNPGAGTSIDSNRYIDINPSPGWSGVTNVSIEVLDTDGLSDTDSFQVTVFGERIILPIVHKE